jgi:hypothetical protein
VRAHFVELSSVSTATTPGMWRAEEVNDSRCFVSCELDRDVTDFFLPAKTPNLDVLSATRVFRVDHVPALKNEDSLPREDQDKPYQ